jgi:1-aminocyclopropane-1-carboxylate deaminase/D-cysteine desulfhydrase-like pyridoxal-dependent ACC family enzyme
MIQSTDLPDTGNAYVQTLHDPLFVKSQVDVDVLRLDKIHTTVSGNKWFKLKFYLKEVAEQHKKGIITFGGAYSNHLIATAYICNRLNLSSIGIIRGEEPPVYSPTLLDVQSYGMNLQFVPRQEYHNANFIAQLKQSYPDFIFVDEGGRGEAGIKGAEEILQFTALYQYTHILCAVGTGTMMTGIINSSLPGQQVIGIPVLKMVDGGSSTISEYINSNCSSRNFELDYRFHFGGYAKKNNELIDFMNRFYLQHAIPTDFVYTGKLFYAGMKLIENGSFKVGANILLIHSGGLQGNRSLPPGMLRFSY